MRSLFIRVKDISLLLIFFFVGIGNYPVILNASELTDWTTEASVNGSIKVPSKILKRAGPVIVAVIDTGVDYTHPQLANRIVTYNNREFVPATSMDFGRDFSPGSLSFKKPYDDNGHGTHIASIITRIAKNIKVLPIKYYNESATEEENLNSTIDAIKFAINSGVKIINYSSGGSGSSSLEREVIELANQNNVLLIAAAGNFGENIDQQNLKYYPASYNNNNIISVINHGPNYKVHKTSNFGVINADISAPGTRVLGAIPRGRLGNLTGTSQSTAFVSAAAGILKGLSPKLSNLTIKSLILRGATKVNALKRKCKTSGALNIEKSIELLKKMSKRNFASSRT